MRLIALILFSIGIGFGAMAQAGGNRGSQDLLANARGLVHDNPDQAIKIGEHLLRNSDSETATSDANRLLAESHWAKGNTNSALIFAFRARKNAAAAGSNERVIRLTVGIAQLLNNLHLDEPSQQYMERAETLAKIHNNQPTTHWIKGKSLTQAALTEISTRHPKEAIQLLRKAAVEFQKLQNPEQATLENETDLNKAIAFTALNQNDSAAYYFDRSMAYFKKHETRNILGLAQLRAELSKLYFQQQQHERAISVLLEALPTAEKLQHTALLKDINKQLAINYLARNDRENYHRYNQKFLALSNRVENQENEATNTAFNLISQDQELLRLENEQQYANIFYATVACLLLIVVFASIQLFKNKSKQKRHREILQYFETENNPVVPVAAPVKKEAGKILNIPAETEQTILAKLKKFEASVKFTNKEMSLAMLAALVDTNTKYLSEIINKHYHDNFNTYINKLRVNYIIGKLKSEPAYLNYKISYLAEESGFSSHSSFATIFKSITGIAPTTFIDFLKEASLKNSVE